MPSRRNSLAGETWKLQSPRQMSLWWSVWFLPEEKRHHRLQRTLESKECIKCVGDAQTINSCAIILPKVRTAIDHSSPTVRMIRLGGSHLNRQVVSLYWEMCRPCLTKFFPSSYLSHLSTHPQALPLLEVEEGINSSKTGLGRKQWMFRWSQRTMGQSRLIESCIDLNIWFLLGFPESAQDQKTYPQPTLLLHPWEYKANEIHCKERRGKERKGVVWGR